MKISSVLIVTWIVLVIPVTDASQQHVSNPPLDEYYFVNQIFDKYGNDQIMTFEGFEHLLESLGLGRLKFDQTHDVSLHKVNGTFREFHDELDYHKHNHNEGLDAAKKVEPRERRSVKETRISRTVDGLTKRCLSPQDILVAYGLEPYHDAVISQSRFTELCPAIVYELDQKSCRMDVTAKVVQNRSDEYYLVWIYATASIFVMSAAGLLCVALVPIVRKSYYKSLLQFLVSLAVGTLTGDALIHLLPAALSYDSTVEDENTPILRGTVVLFAVLVFFCIENVLKIIQNKKNREISGDFEPESGTTLRNETACEGPHGHSHGGAEGGVAPVAWMVIMGDILHNVSDGLSIGAAFSTSATSGLSSSIAIFCHELPHELGDYAVLLNSGMSVKRALFYNLVSSVFSFIGMVGGVLLGEIQHASLWINAFTAGTFLYIALSDLIPEMKQNNSKDSTTQDTIIQLLGIVCGGALMFSIALYENDLEKMFS